VLSQAQGALFGGGRYDGLAEALGGPRVPGVGFGMGLERVKLALQDEGVASPEEPPLQAFVVSVGEAGRTRAVEVLRALRQAGASAASGFDDRSLGAQMKAADRAGARFAVIVGEREAVAGTVTLRRLSDGEQRELGLEEATAWMATAAEGGS